MLFWDHKMCLNLHIIKSELWEKEVWTARPIPMPMRKIAILKPFKVSFSNLRLFPKIIFLLLLQKSCNRVWCNFIAWPFWNLRPWRFALSEFLSQSQFKKAVKTNFHVVSPFYLFFLCRWGDVRFARKFFFWAKIMRSSMITLASSCL